MSVILKFMLGFVLFCLPISSYSMKVYPVEGGGFFSDNYYKVLSQKIDNDIEFKKNFYKTIKEVCISEGWEKTKNPYLLHVLIRKGMLKILKNTALVIIKKYKKSHIFFIGQSLAYLGEACRVLDTYGNNLYVNVAYSGKHLVLKEEKTNNNEKKIKRYVENKNIIKQLTQIRRDSFFGYLKQMNVHPDQIILRHEKYGEKTVLIDFVSQGESLASFLDLLFSSVKKEKQNALQQSLAVHAFYMVEHKNDAFKYLVLPGSSVIIDVTLNCLPQEFIGNLANSDDFNDRLVPQFKHDQWGLIDPLAFNIISNAAYILFLVHEYLKKESKIPDDFWL